MSRSAWEMLWSLYKFLRTLFFKKIWGAYQSGKFLRGHFGFETLLRQFLLSLWKTQRILIFLIYHRKKHINTWLSILDTWLYLWAEFSNCPCCRWPWDWKRIASLAPCLVAGSPFGGVARSHARVARCCRSLARSHAACFARHTWRAC